MTHTLTYNNIQNVQLHHDHFGSGIGPYALAPAHKNAPAPAHAHAYAPARNRAHTYAPAPAPAVLCSRLNPCHPQNDNPVEAESFHG
ncbi:hypothetical protein O181_104849 [Austropuccinia psidii MF-1]|uniref:Uncharacterized protein n=1 Tax=Austropuccinia psidii MF-1 TaxID=1389203 RepID=A0A9Q3JP22_9BASI|nr:hypothetical protein [Austropuccinia psidii MF-1]